MKNKIFYLVFLLLLSLFTSCSSDDNDAITSSAYTPEMDISVYPTSGLTYGDDFSITGELRDGRNLKMYTVIVKDSQGNILSTKEQMLLGQSFQINDKLSIPLPKNAQEQDLTVEFVLKNTVGSEINEEFTLSSLKVPQFDKLYLIMSNNTTVELLKNGDVYEANDFFAANSKGVIAATPGNTGLYWGLEDGEIQSMGKDSIPIGTDVEASCKISFNPSNFELTFGDRHSWSALPETDSYYILGTISGHWQDGVISTERAKMRMQGYESGDLRYYTWIPPEGADPETGMWGSTAKGLFTLKKAGEDSYIMWKDKKITVDATNVADDGFYLSAGGAFEIRVYFEGDDCTEIKVMDSKHTLQFMDDEVKINGMIMQPQITFGGATIALKDGFDYMYDSNITLEKGVTIESSLNLSDLIPSTGVVSGVGNSTWTLLSNSGNYIVNIDVFSGVCSMSLIQEYPNAIFLDGWSWATAEGGAAIAWDPTKALTLTKNGTTYEGVCYVYGWGGDYRLYLKPPVIEELILPSDNFTGPYVTSTPGSFLFPTVAGTYKIIVDLKDGLNIGDDNSITYKGTDKFTIKYELQ